MHKAHAAVIKRLEGVADINAARLDHDIGGHTYEHFAAHAQHIRRWRLPSGR